MLAERISSRIEIPSFVDMVDDHLLDEILTTGKWVSHGGDVCDQWSGGVFDHALENAHPSLIGRDYDEVRRLVEFRQALKTVLLQSAEWQERSLLEGSSCDDLAPFVPESVIYRGVTAERPDGSAGVHWSQKRDQSLDRFIDHDKGGLLFAAKASDVTIDWPGTIRSRLDLSNGQDEAEIRLVRNSPIAMKMCKVTYEGHLPKMSAWTMLDATA